MPDLETHCKQSLEAFGDNYKKVHLWLDEFFGKPPYGAKHRHLRHHIAGIEEAQRRFGGRAGEAARQHIIADLEMDNWKLADGIPLNAADYVSRNLF